MIRFRSARLFTGAFAFALAVLAAPAPAQEQLKIVGGSLTHQPAELIPGIQGKVMITAATLAGKRIVAVGDHGAVLLSDDSGRRFRQAAAVPTRATLTGVSFADDQHGWAVGHWGVILATSDGGEHWEMQRDELKADRPLLSVWFRDAGTGFAAGIWSNFLMTRDGGKTWTIVPVPAPPGSKHADLNLFRIFGDGRGGFYVAAEKGLVLHSADDGAHWDFLDTGGKGSLWAGVTLHDGTIVVGGLLGKVFRSTDQGRSWQAAKLESDSSVTDLTEAMGGRVLAVGLDGLSAISADDGASFMVNQREDRLSLTAAAVAGVQLVLFSKQGVVAAGAH